MNQKTLFERLGAPLGNVRWSWGAVRQQDGAVFLRVWQDECRGFNNRLFMRITDHDYFSKNDPANLGWLERLKHVDLIRNDPLVYMVMCVAEDINATPRKVKGFNKNEVFTGGCLVDCDGETWLELGERVNVTDA